MSSKSRPQADPLQVQFTSLRISGFGIRAQTDGRTGLEAWRIMRRRHPRVVWLAAGYAALLALVAVLWASSLY